MISSSYEAADYAMTYCTYPMLMPMPKTRGYLKLLLTAIVFSCTILFNLA